MLSAKIFKFLLIGLLSFILITGCSKDDDKNISGPQVSEKANVRVVHTSVDAPAVDIWVDGQVAISTLEYRQTSGYVALDAGKHTIQVTPAGATSPIVIDETVTLNDGTDYTVYAIGKLANISALISEDNRTPNSNKVKVRFLHASPDAPAVDIKVNSGTGAVVFGNRSFNTISDYIEVDATSYSFAVTAAGSAQEVVVLDPVQVTTGSVYTVIAFGTLDANDNIPFSVRAFVDNNNGDDVVDFSFANAMVNVIHASPDAPGVDLLLDGTIVNSAPLEFPNNTGYLTVDAGTRNIKVNANGTSTTVINADVTFLAQKNYSIFASNFLNMIEPVVVEDDLTSPAAGKAHVRFIHLSPDAPTVDITLADGTTIFDDVSFKEASVFLPLDAGTYDLQVRTSDGVTVVLDLPGVTLTNGNIYTVFAKGSLTGTGGQNLAAEIIINK